MAARIPVKAIYSGSDVTSLGEFTSSDTIAGSYLTDGSVTAAKLAADTATQAELDAVAAAALPLAGGTMTGNLVMGTNLVDGVDISERDAILTSTTTTAGAALPKAGGAMTGAITTNSTFDTRDVATDGTKLDTIATSANLYVHPLTAGYKHIPTGGSAGQVLKYSSSGTAVWGTDENDAVAMAIALG